MHLSSRDGQCFEYFRICKEARLIVADEAENPQLSALLSMRASESSSVRFSGALVYADATRRSHVREPVATDPRDGLRIPTYEALFEQARMDLNDQLVRRFQVLRIGSGGKRAVAAILARHPLETNSR
jgi:hypothetical protein